MAEKDPGKDGFMQNFFTAFSSDPSKRVEDVQLHMKNLLKRKVGVLVGLFCGADTALSTNSGSMKPERRSDHRVLSR